MPPKSNTLQEIVEVRRQITNLTKDVKTVYDLLNKHQERFDQFKDHYDVHNQEIVRMLNTIREAVEDSQSNARNDVLSSDQSLVIDSNNQQRLGIIPAPRIVQVIEGKRVLNKMTIKKEHIVSLVIQSSDENMENTTVEAYYNTVLKERSPVLETVAEKRRILLNSKNKKRKSTRNDSDVTQMDSISEQSHFIGRPTAPVSWASLSDKDRETAIAALEAAVLDETGINFGLCENSWAANHLLCEAWNNLMNGARKVYADYQEKLGAEIDGGLDGSSL
ncbi:hypothetical protein BDC45DRAFT_611365 [Circinella umbellata]|nr:hypothetical protein BDC45DRAFT_611365 [Circinella umbellata]